MKLFHGSLVKIESPKILFPSEIRTRDFGNGFYTTSNRDQAIRWAQIRMKRDNSQVGYVSVYEVHDELLRKTELNTLIFSSATVEWLHFVMENRRERPKEHFYDIVAGPVANDRVYTTLTLFENHLLDEDETLRRLKTSVLVDQILFHTEKSLNELRFIEFEEIS